MPEPDYTEYIEGHSGKVLVRQYFETHPDLSKIEKGRLRELVLESFRKRSEENRLHNGLLYLTTCGAGAGKWSYHFSSICIADTFDTVGILNAMKEEFPESVIIEVVIHLK